MFEKSIRREKKQMHHGYSFLSLFIRPAVKSMTFVVLDVIIFFHFRSSRSEGKENVSIGIFSFFLHFLLIQKTNFRKLSFVSTSHIFDLFRSKEMDDMSFRNSSFPRTSSRNPTFLIAISMIIIIVSLHRFRLNICSKNFFSFYFGFSFFSIDDQITHSALSSFSFICHAFYLFVNLTY